MKKIIIIIFVASVIALFGCQPPALAEEEIAGDLLSKLAENQDGTQDEDIPLNNPLGFSNEVIEGLHVTGKPVEVDIDEYRLKVTGEVDNPLSLTFSQVKEMESKRMFAVLNCPGFFTDEGYWTGVDLRYLLELTGLHEGAFMVSFTSIDGYTGTLSLESIMESEGMLVAYHFQDKEFPEVHGYPLRIVAEAEPGNVWVKWLAEIIVLDSDDKADNTMPENNG
jgi:DMSO/TMAO reductase YedYZ molybdopterin-dependent catalytic subunit